ncbi:MAG: WG repeat-containing protein [Clostridia bacterium]|nr:WG repeat-containing protein [Clostridia bacterium]
MKKILSLLLITVISLLPIHTVCAYEGYTVMREPIYNMADSFYSNVTKVSKNSLWGICDTNGYPITGYNWEAMGEIVDKYIPAKYDGLWGYISYEGDVLIPYQFQKAENFSDDLARVMTAEGKYAYINRSGEIAFISPFDYSFTPGDGAVCGVQGGLYGYCDTTGSIIIHPQFDMGFDFHEGFAAVKFGEKWGYITTYGAYQVKPTYKFAGDFKDGYAVCALDSGYGIIDTTGKRTSAFTFDYIGEPDDKGRFPAKANGKSGYINAQGKWLMQTDYDFCYTFTDGVARVFKDNLWGYINEQGDEIVTPVFADCGEYRNGRAFYSMDGYTYGFLTLEVTKSEEPVEVPVVTPSNPAAGNDKPSTPEPTDTKDESVGTYEEIIDVADIESIPTIPGAEKCISMRIGSPYALKQATAKRLTAAPALINGVTMVPLRDVVEYMGGTITWDASTKRISISLNRKRISLTIGSKISFVNGVAATVSSAPELIDGITMIPLRSVASSLGCEIEWIPETQNIYIHY